MIGAVNAALDAVLQISVRNDLQKQIQIDAVVDTGFTDYLSLQLDQIEELDLEETVSESVMLADGRRVLTRIFIGRVLWNAEERIVPIQASEGMPLIGMQLLLNQRLTLDVCYNGIVRIEPLP